MESNIKIGHPFYFPTQVVLLDDDPDFLDGVSLMLNRDLSYKLFQSANKALDYVNHAHQHVQFLQRCYTSYKTGPAESDALSHIDIGKLHLEILNSGRFQTCSSVIVDYSMPEMNGLEFLMKIRNPFIKKVLLTGQADMELAVKAFNKQLIDQFIDKHDPRLKLKLNAAIATFQEQYFSGSFKLITDPIIANNHDGFLVDAGFQHYFQELREQLDCVEYYMIDNPHNGFLLMDSDGKRQCLLIYTAEALEEHAEMLAEAGAPMELQAKVKAGELLPDYNGQEHPLAPGDKRLVDWRQRYHPTRRLNTYRTFYTALVPTSVLDTLNHQTIIPYGNFLASNCTLNEVVH